MNPLTSNSVNSLPDCQQHPLCSIPNIAIRSDYFHHGANGGYKQLLNYTNPRFVLGVDESKTSSLISRYSICKYKWLAEFQAARLTRKHNIRLVHILYAEEYFRFSTYLLPKSTKVVVTFHQPPELLLEELRHGNRAGRIYGWTHRLTRSRLKQVHGVIVITREQHDIVKRFVEPSKVRCIPLGCHSEEKIHSTNSAKHDVDINQILTVGNWQRDWHLYSRFVQYCYKNRPELRFILVNRKLPQHWAYKLSKLPNFSYLDVVDDQFLSTLYRASVVQLLPLLSAAGNNAVNESLAYGCPVVSNCKLDLVSSPPIAAQSNLGGDLSVLESAIDRVRLCQRRDQLRVECQTLAMNYDWSSVALQTLDFYKEVLEC